VAYVASPVNFTHARAHQDITTWLGTYRALTPGVVGGNDATVRLDLDNEPQPDVLLRWDEDHHGQSVLTSDDRIEGAPELVAEVAATSASYDLHDKMNAYRRNGVQEYIAWQVYEQRLDWFRLREGVYVPLAPDERGVIHSEVFPGLRLNVAAMLAGDLAAVVAEQLTPRS